MTDIHQHVLWGMDDGPDTPEEMYAMLEAAHAQRVGRIAATPHAYPGIRPFDMDKYVRRLEEARRYCAENGLDMQVMTGAEVAWTYHAAQALRTGQIPTLNGGNCALIELWHGIGWHEVYSAAEQLLRSGITPVFAHVERYRCFAWQPGKTLELKRELPVMFQVNASAVLAEKGLMIPRFIRRMLDEEAIDAVASDAHNCEGRPVRMKQAYRALKKRCSAEYAKALVNFSGV